jgi:SPP1 gp7 family putative phage head morphogenesis protein
MQEYMAALETYVYDGAKVTDIGKLIFGNDGGAAVSVMDAFKAVPWLYRAILLRAGAVAGMPFSLMRGKEDVTSNEEYKRLTGKLKRQLWLTEACLITGGASYLILNTNLVGKEITPRWVLPSTIEPVTDEVKGLTGFIRKVGSKDIPIPLDRIVYFWMPSLETEVGPGTCDADVALNAAGVLLNADRMIENYFKRGAIKITLLTVEGNPPKEELDRLEHWWKRMISGIRKAYESIAIRASIKPVIIGSDLKETDAGPLTDKKREDIAVAIGVPQALLFQSSAYATARHEDQLIFIERTVLPECDVIAEALNEQLFNREGLVLAFHPDKLAVMQAAQLAKSQAVFQLTGQPILTVDEGRDLIGREPMALTQSATANAAQEELRTWQRFALRRFREGKAEKAAEFKCNFVPMGRAAQIAEALKAARTVEEVEQVFGETPALIPDPSPKYGGREEEETHNLSYMSSVKSIGYGSDGHKSLMGRFDRRANKYEKQLSRVVKALFNQQQEAVLAGLRKRATRSVGVNDEPFDVDEWRKEFEKSVAPILENIVETVGQNTLDDYAIEMAFNVDEPAVAHFLSRRAQRFAKRVNETTWEELKASLRKGIEGGENITQLEARVLDVMAGRIRSTPETIVRTEVIGAANGGTLEAWKQSGVVATKTWMATLDSRTRDSHVDAHGQTVPIEADFVVGGARGPAPGQLGVAEEDINCRCTMKANLE